MSDYALFFETLQQAEADTVFVRVEEDGFFIWEKVSKEEAEKENMRIIMCSRCKMIPASQIDHLYPYFDDYCLCKNCKNITESEE